MDRRPGRPDARRPCRRHARGVDRAGRHQPGPRPSGRGGPQLRAGAAGFCRRAGRHPARDRRHAYRVERGPARTQRARGRPSAPDEQRGPRARRRAAAAPLPMARGRCAAAAGRGRPRRRPEEHRGSRAPLCRRLLPRRPPGRGDAGPHPDRARAAGRGHVLAARGRDRCR